MRGDNWVPIDKSIRQDFKFIDRPFSRVEALVSFSIDKNCGCAWSIKGYANQWRWSREKVRKFVNELQTEEGFNLNAGKTQYRHPVHLVSVGLEPPTDTEPTLFVPTPSRHTTDTLPTPDRHPKSSNNEGFSRQTDTEPTQDRHKADTGPDPTIKTETETDIKNNVELSKTRPHIPYKEIVDLLNSEAGTNYQSTTKATRSKIKARFNEGFSFEHFEAVIKSRAKAWKGNPEMVQYLRPSTLFNTKFEEYLQAAGQIAEEKEKKSFDFSALRPGVVVELKGKKYKLDDSRTFFDGIGRPPFGQIKELYRNGRLTIVKQSEAVANG